MVRTRKAQRPARGRRPRDRILHSAIELFALHGFDSMTMRQLGAAVDLDNSSLYRHFSSKSVLASAVLDRVAGDMLAVIGATIGASQSVSLQALEDVCIAASLHLFDRPATARLLVHWIMSMGKDGPGFQVAVSATDKSRPSGKLLAKLRDWLQDGVRHGVLRKHATPEAIVFLFGALLIRPATYGYLLASLEPRRARGAARAAWEGELRAAIRGAFAP